jgi:hypothetical protein
LSSKQTLLAEAALEIDMRDLLGAKKAGLSDNRKETNTDFDKDEVFSLALAGLPKVSELIATFSAEDRQRALEAAEQSYLETARGLGYQETDALQWAEAVMFRLRLTQPIRGASLMPAPAY